MKQRGLQFSGGCSLILIIYKSIFDTPRYGSNYYEATQIYQEQWRNNVKHHLFYINFQELEKPFDGGLHKLIWYTL